jgi:phage gp29-like protein
MAKSTKRGTASRGGKRTVQMGAVSPPPAVPGTDRGFGSYPPVDTTSATVKAANSPEALRGRISYTAGPTLTRYSTYPADGISAEMIKSAQKSADLGYPRLQAEMYEQIIEADAHLRGVAKARIYEVSGKPHRIQPRNESPLAVAVAKFCRAAIDEIDGFDSDVDDLLWANGNGYAASEIVWGFGRLRFPVDKARSVTINALAPRSLDWVHAKHFEFDAITDEPYLVLNPSRIRLPPHKFVFHGAADTGFYERRGYMRPCVRLYAAKAWALRDWLLYEALFAVPQITGTYPNDREEYEEQRDVYQAMMRDWGKSVPAFIPDDIEFKITTAQSGGNATSVQGAILGYCNQEISKLVQGETLTTEVGNVGAYAATETHADVRHAFVRSDARKLAGTLHDQLLSSIVELNVGVLATALGASPEDILRAVPLIKWSIDRETSPSQRIDNLIKLANAGVPIGLDQVYDEAGVEPPREGAPLLRGDPVTVADGGVAVGSQAATGGVDNPKDEQDRGSGDASTSQGGGDG